jgi:hypothetical protein
VETVDGRQVAVEVAHDARLRESAQQVAWCQELEGSYAPMAQLASVDHLGKKWRSTTTAIAPWSGTTTATAAARAGSCASMASR